MKRFFGYLGFVLLLSTLVFLFSENIDLYFSEMFFKDSFYLKNNLFIEIFDKYLEFFIVILFAGCCLLWGLTKLNILNILNTSKMVFLGFCLVCWCVILPKGLKYFYHRARPFQTDLYFGGCDYTNAFELSTCHIGDSFISGHTSFAMFLVAVALLTPEKIKAKSIIAALCIVLLTGLSRIMGGYHYFTDVYFAVVLVGLGIWMTYKILFISREQSFFY